MPCKLCMFPKPLSSYLVVNCLWATEDAPDTQCFRGRLPKEATVWDSASRARGFLTWSRKDTEFTIVWVRILKYNMELLWAQSAKGRALICATLTVFYFRDSQIGHKGQDAQIGSTQQKSLLDSHPNPARCASLQRFLIPSRLVCTRSWAAFITTQWAEGQGKMKRLRSPVAACSM